MRTYITPFLVTILLSEVAAASSLTYTYDALGRLTGVVYDSGITVTYTYDAMGNRTGKTTAISPSLDTDGDGVPDLVDGCPFSANDPIGDPCNPDDCADGTLPDLVGNPCAHNDCADTSLQDGLGDPCVHDDCADGSIQDAVGDPCVHDDFADSLAAPLLFAPADDAIGQPRNVMVDWQGAPGAVSYRLFVASSEVTLSALGTVETACVDCAIDDTVSTAVGDFYNIPFGALSANTTYYWMVRASAPGLNSANSAIWAFTTAPEYFPAPSFPLPPDGAINQPQNVTLDWSDTPGAADYHLFLAASQATLSALGDAEQSCPACLLDDTVPASVGSFYNLPWGLLSVDTTYYWKVRAHSPSLGTVSSAIWSFKTKPTILAAPALFNPANGAVNQPQNVMLDWSDPKGAVTYRVFVADAQSTLSALSDADQVCAGCLLNDTVPASVGSFYNLPWGLLAANTTYYWRVQASFSGAGSLNSVIWPFTTSSGSGSGDNLWMKTFSAASGAVAAVDLSGGVVIAGAPPVASELRGARPMSAGLARGVLVELGADWGRLWGARLGSVAPGFGAVIASDRLGGLIMASSPGRRMRPGTSVESDGDLPLPAGRLDDGGERLVKLDTEGNELWWRALGDGASPVHVEEIGVDALDRIWVAGRCEGDEVDLGGPVVSCVEKAAFAAQLDAKGTNLGVRQVGASVGRYQWDLVGPSPGGFVTSTYVVGRGQENDALLLARYDAEGELLWSKAMPITADADLDAASPGLIFDHAGNVIVYLSSFRGSVDFGKGAIATVAGEGQTEYVVAKLDPRGDCLWSLHFGNADGGGQYLDRVAVDSQNNVVVAGSLTGVIDLGGGSVMAPTEHAAPFVAKFDSNGRYLWSQVVLQSEMIFSAIAFDAQDDVLVSGRAHGSVGFGGAALSGDEGSFVAKFSR